MISEGDTQNWRQESDAYECAFIVSATKKQRILSGRIQIEPRKQPNLIRIP